MKKISFAVIVLLLMLCVFTFTACGEESGDSGDSRPELTLTTNIEGAGTVTGGGHYDSGTNIVIEAQANDGYWFLGWYQSDVLLSTSTAYTYVTENIDYVIEAKFAVLPQDFDASSNIESLTVKVYSANPKLGLVQIGSNDVAESSSSQKEVGDYVKLQSIKESFKDFLGWFDISGNLIASSETFEFAMPSFDCVFISKWACDNHDGLYTANSKFNQFVCEACGGDAIYNISENGFNIVNGNTLVAYTGKDDNVVIPSNVISISEHAFDGCKSIKKIVVPDSVKKLDSGIFKYCSSLEEITLPFVGYSREEYTSSDSDSFTLRWVFKVFEVGSGYRVAKYSIPKNLKKVNITGGDIYDDAFRGCGTLIEISLPNDLKRIGKNAFADCKKLAKISIPSSVTSIGGSAFDNCTELNDVYISDIAAWCNISFDATSANPLSYASNLYCNGNLVAEAIIPDNVTNIAKYAFYSCDSITSLTIPNSVTTIGEGAFSGCNSLVEVFISENVESIGVRAFSSCSNLTAITVDSNNKTYRDIDGNLYTKDGKNFVCYATGKSEISFVIPDGVTNIDTYSFYDSTKLISITIPNSVKNIDSCAFENCYKLAEVINKSSLDIKRNNASYGNVSSYAVEVHKGTSKIINVNDYLFYTYKGKNYLITYIGNEETLVLPEKYNNEVYIINEYAFADCTKLTSVTIPDCITEINSYTFYDCTGLKSITIANSVTEIGNYAFYGCTNLFDVSLPNSISYIGTGAFSGCSSLESITIPEGVKRIYDYVFKDCQNLTNIVIPDSIISIGGQAFSNCTNLVSVTIGDGVTEIYSKAFSNCTNLTSIVLPKSLTSIGDNAFSNTNLKVVKYRGSSDQWFCIENWGAIPYQCEIDYYYQGD